MYRNSEGYASPTEGAAYAHIAQEGREKRRQHEAAQRKEQQSIQRAKQRAETMALLKQLDETGGWKLAWTAPTDIPRHKKEGIRA